MTTATPRATPSTIFILKVHSYRSVYCNTKEKISSFGSRFPRYAERGHSTLLFVENAKEMYQDLQRTCIAIVPLFEDVPRCRWRRASINLSFVCERVVVKRCCSVSSYWRVLRD